jgi:hypothetical protein
VAWLSGIKVKFSDGKSGQTGTCDDSSKFEEYNFDAEKVETITSMSLQGMGTGEWDQVRKMEFSTAKNKPFSVGWPKKKDQQVYKMDVGSGILIGFMGASGTEIDRIAPIFLKPVKQMYIDKVEYPTLDLNKTDFLQIQSLARGKAQYNGASYKYTLTGQEEVSTATTWNQKFTMELGTEIMWKANVIFASEEVKLSLKLGGQFDRGGSTTKSRLLRWNFEKQINGPYDTIEFVFIPSLQSFTFANRGLIDVSQHTGPGLSTWSTRAHSTLCYRMASTLRSQQKVPYHRSFARTLSRR